MSRAVCRVLVLITLLGCVFAARAGDGALELVRGVRAPAQAVIAISDLRALRRTPAGESATLMLLEAGLLERTRVAWAELAEAADLDASDAVDAMLGNRVVLVLGESSAGVRPWALVSEIDAAVADRLRRTLGPAPRGIVRGRPVFALEQGRFELAVGAASRTTTRVILSPGGDASMLDALLLAAGREPPAGSAGALAREMASLAGAPVAAGVRLGDATFIATAIATGETVQIATVSSPGVLWSPSDCCEAVGLWPVAVLDAAPEDALLTVFGVRGDKLAGAAMPALLPSLTAAAGALGEELDGFVRALDRRTGFIMTEDAGTLTVEMVAALRGDGATAATDAAMERIASLGDDPGSGAGFGGVFPAALRSVPYPGSGGALGSEPTISWVYTDGPGGLWWTARFGDAPGVPEVAAWAVPIVEPAVGPGAIVAFGRARPARLGVMFEPLASPALRWIDEIEWVARPGAGDRAGRVSSRVTIRFVPARDG